MSVYITTWKMSKQQVKPVLVVVCVKFTFQVNMAVVGLIRGSTAVLDERNWIHWPSSLFLHVHPSAGWLTLTAVSSWLLQLLLVK